MVPFFGEQVVNERGSLRNSITLGAEVDFSLQLFSRLLNMVTS